MTGIQTKSHAPAHRGCDRHTVAEARPEGRGQGEGRPAPSDNWVRFAQLIGRPDRRLVLPNCRLSSLITLVLSPKNPDRHMPRAKCTRLRVPRPLGRRLGLFGAPCPSDGSAGGSAERVPPAGHRLGAPLQAIGFVSPRPIECAIHHNSFPAKPLPVLSPGRELALFVQLPAPGVPQALSGQIGFVWQNCHGVGMVE